MDATVEKIVAEMSRRIGGAPPLGGALKIDFGEPGSLFIDGSGAVNAVVSGAGQFADCTVSLSLDTFERLVKRQLDPAGAFFQGKLRIAGDSSLAMKLGPLLQAASD